jgi:hypothetical protein
MTTGTEPGPELSPNEEMVNRRVALEAASRVHQPPMRLTWQDATAARASTVVDAAIVFEEYLRTGRRQP